MRCLCRRVSPEQNLLVPNASESFCLYLIPMKPASAFSRPDARVAGPRPSASSPSLPRRYRPLPRWLRVVATAMLPVYFVTSIPAYLQAQTVQAMHEAADAVIASFTPAPPEIKVNRSLPPGVVDDNAPAPHASATSSALHFSSVAPKDGEFFQARIFAEPLVPTDGKAVPTENEALAQALLAYAQAPAKADTDVADRLAPINQFLADHPGSRWGLSLWLNVGSLYRHAGYWTHALDAWEQAWADGKQATSPNARAMADLAVAELAELNARLGRYERLQPLFAELEGVHRELRGAAAEKLSGARQGLWLMDHQPELAFRCGPMALNCLRLAENPKAAMEPKIFEAHSTRQGISLSQVAALSRDIGRPMQMAFRTADGQGKEAEFLTPSVVHWKAGHYAALVEQKGGRYRVDDPTFGDTTWVSQAALEAETDGYYLVAAKTALPAGWRTVPEAEGNKVWGKGNTNGKDPNCTRCKDPRAKACASCYGMATYNIEAMLTSLAIGDMPMSYTPPVGASIGFALNYSQHEASQPAVFTYWNMGNKWTSQWSCYIEDAGTAAWELSGYVPIGNPDGSVTYYPIFLLTGGIFEGPLPIVHLPGGGVENYQAQVQRNSYIPADGEAVYFDYASQDQILSYKYDSITALRYQPWGGGYTALTPDNYAVPVELQDFAHPRLVQIADKQYKRYLPDGTVETYSHSDDATSYPRRIFLTERKDPSSNATTFSYDKQNRLLAVTDALGQVTTLSYNLASDPLKVTSVTDPFGRSCQLAYQADGHLQSITDTAGIQSSFTYLPNSDSTSSDFINKLTTPYGDTTFAFADVTTDPTMGVAAWLEATDMYGDTERAEFRHGAPGIPFSESAVPAGIPVFNAYISSRNTYYWDKKAYKEARQSDGTFDYTRAKIMHFMHDVDTNVTSGVLESTKQPLENRVWMFYQGENSPGFFTNGQSTNPSLVARVLDDGTTQLSQYQYNDQQRVTQATDPLGRVTTYDYDPTNNIDLLDARNTTGGLNEQLFSATYNSAHQPLTQTDAAGQTTILAYNANGQMLTSQDPLQRTVTFQYNGQGYLQEIDGFDPSIKSTFTYDGFGRLASTTTYPDAYTVQVTYDAVGGNPLTTLNRPATAVYPDGSYTEVDYTNLDVEWKRDRAGNWTHMLTNKLRQTVANIDPLGSITQFGYCKCGQLVSIVDPNGNNTQWKLDMQERPAAKIYADGTEVDYTYENTTSRLKRVTDAKGQTTTYQYNLDGTTASIAYAGSAQATPGVSYSYDPQRARLTSMVDGIGTASYSYYPFGSGGPGALGAGRVQSVDGPFANEMVSYQYDQLGRVTKRTVDGMDETFGYEPLGRLQTDTNALGTFTYGYDGTTGRVSSVGYPNGQQALYSYSEDNTQDRRLSQIKHLTPSGGLLDQFDYSYDGPLGHIAHWGQQQPGATAGTMATNAYGLGYDTNGQLTQAVLNGDGTNLGSGVWSYDPAGNRTGIQSGSGTLSTAVPTPINSLFSLSGGGNVQVAGSLSKWANVTVNGRTANLNAANNTFQASVPLSLGTQTLTIRATDASGNAASNQYQLTISAGVGESFGYDSNGNTLSLASSASETTPQTLEWDALDRVTAINTGTHRTEFTYDGSGARVRLTEKDNGSVTKDRLFVLNEERDAASGQILRTFYDQGEQRTAGSYFYASDHLGSLRELTDSTGTVRASYGYDLWGARTKLQGNLDTELGFTGYWHHTPSGFEISPTRLYSASLGRFLSQDPLQEGSGQLNLFAYCANDPVNLVDLLGLSWGGIGVGLAVGLGVVAVAVLLAPEFAASFIGAMLIGALSGFAGDLAGQLYDNGFHLGCVNWKQAFTAAELGALFGAAGYFAAPAIGMAFRGAAAYVGGLLAGSAPNTFAQLSAAAARAISAVGPGSGGAYGTLVHSAFEDEVNALGNPALSTEVSYLRGAVVPRGTSGSVRLDVVEGPLNAPTSIFDLKTGTATLTPARVLQIQGNVPGGSSVPVIEVR